MMMPRPKKHANIEEELMKIDANITRKTKEIEELKQDRSALIKQKEQQEISQLYAFCKASGLSAGEVIQMVSKSAPEKKSV